MCIVLCMDNKVDLTLDSRDNSLTLLTLFLHCLLIHYYYTNIDNSRFKLKKRKLKYSANSCILSHPIKLHTFILYHVI